MNMNRTQLSTSAPARASQQEAQQTFSQAATEAMLAALDCAAATRETLRLHKWVQETGGFESEAEANAALVGFLVAARFGTRQAGLRPANRTRRNARRKEC